MTDIHAVLAATARMAGNSPLIILNPAGRVMHSSTGGRTLSGWTVEVDEPALRFDFPGEDGTGSATLPRELWTLPLSEALAHLHPPDGGMTCHCRITSERVGDEDQPMLMMCIELDSAGALAAQQAGGLVLGPPVEVPGATKFFGMWTRAPQMKSLFRTIERVAESDVTVLIRGESGTGKEHVARAIHGLSPRRNKQFVAINCATLSPTLAESELFGHVKGAFTGAVRDHSGYFEQADGGTIFLDEVAEIPLDLQGKLLRVLQDHTFVPVGGTRPRTVNVRLLSATHRSLRQAVADKRFRDDLMYRLRVVPLFLPALRERRGDIELMLAHFSELLAGMPGRHRFRRVAADAMRAMLDYTWPGNVRELQNVLEYASVVGTSDVLTRQDLPPEFRDDDPLASSRRIAASIDLEMTDPDGDTVAASPTLAGAEMTRIRQALAQANGHKGKAAEMLGMHRTTLWRKLRELGLV